MGNGNNNNNKGDKMFIGGGRKMNNPPPFLSKTYMLVDDPKYDDVISWNDVGSGFVVWQPAEFARDLLPTLFKHSNFSSFVRQLNTYGFKKVATNRWEFSNEMFQKGKKELLNQIHRRKAWSNRQQPPTPSSATTPKESPGALQNNEDDQRSWSTSSSSELSTLVDENKRLKQENGVLSSELITMRRKCHDLLELVAIYADQTEEMERESDEKRPMLFGVRLDVNGEEKRKRKRTLEICETARVLLSQSCK